MDNILAIFKKEFKSYFVSPIAYVVITAFLVITNFLFFNTFFLANQAEMRSYFEILPWVFLLFVPTITMRSWSEERKGKTLELLLTWPVSDFQVVIGKFIAAFSFLSVAILLSVSIPITLALIGKPDMGPIVGSYIGALLMGAAYIAIGMWVSSYTENQIIAFILSGVAILFLLLIGIPFLTMALPREIQPFLSYLGLGNHFDSIQRGVIDSRDILYYLSTIGFFLFLNIQSLASRKWE